MLIRIACLAALLITTDSFAEDEPARVAAARAKRESTVRAAFAGAGVSYPAAELLIRIFKEEGTLEVWAGGKGAGMKLVRSYPICAKSGALGPKRRFGDLQVPEGFYRIDRFNPWSNFHLSLGLDYPNASDRQRGEAGHLGGDIFIHGGCATIGCVPIEDEAIEELFVIAKDAQARPIPVHVFPGRMDERGLAALAKTGSPELVAFWRELAPAYTAFEDTHRPPRIDVDPRTGAYRVTPAKARKPPVVTARAL